MVSEPQGSAHYTAIGLVEDALRAALGPGWLVRSQGPLALTDDSEPEPDVAVTRGIAPRLQSRAPCPARARRRGRRIEPLARPASTRGVSTREAGVADYWILNLVDRVLEIYREPIPDPTSRFGWRYASTEMRVPGTSAAPLAAPEARIPVVTCCRNRELVPAVTVPFMGRSGWLAYRLRTTRPSRITTSIWSARGRKFSQGRHGTTAAETITLSGDTKRRRLKRVVGRPITRASFQRRREAGRFRGSRS